MKIQLSIITAFVLLNMGIGRLFQESIGVVCFTELSIIAITGFFFWNIAAGTLKKWSGKWNVFRNQKSLATQSGLGLATVAVYTFIGHFMVIFLMATLYNCTSPSSELINASLTNNIAVNLLCYFSLLLFFQVQNEEVGNSAAFVALTIGFEKISVSRAGSKFLLSPKEVIYVEAANNCVVLHTEKGKFVKYQSLKSLQSKLPYLNFKRTHRSFLVNTDFIERIKKNKSGDGKIMLSNGDTVKLSRTYQNAIS